jgi:hypothetical protein
MAAYLKSGPSGGGMTHEPKPLDHERVVTLSADDMDKILGALDHMTDAIYDRDEGSLIANLCAVQGIVEELRGKFDL